MNVFILKYLYRLLSKRNWHSCLVVIVTLFMVVGCSKKYDTYPVQGSVKFTDGVPLAGAYVTFEAADRPLRANAVADSKGRFKLSTTGKSDGAVPGEYLVVVLPPYHDPESSSRSPAVPSKYRSYETSGLKFSIAATDNQIDIVLDRN